MSGKTEQTPFLCFCAGDWHIIVYPKWSSRSARLSSPQAAVTIFPLAEREEYYFLTVTLFRQSVLPKWQDKSHFLRPGEGRFLVWRKMRNCCKILVRR